MLGYFNDSIVADNNLLSMKELASGKAFSANE